jgi:hypothetical protein
MHCGSRRMDRTRPKALVHFVFEIVAEGTGFLEDCRLAPSAGPERSVAALEGFPC